MDLVDAMARYAARMRGQAIPIRGTSALAPEPGASYGVAVIRLVGEERLQAVAYGQSTWQRPYVALTTNALDRQANFLESFALDITQYIQFCLDANRLPRVWFAEDAAWEAFSLLGPRYARNRSASEPVRALGRLCNALALEAEYAGQQVVAIAARLFRAHFATGQSPSDDIHLRSLLTWFEPAAFFEDDVPAWRAADEAALLPAASMLDRESDDTVERLRSRRPRTAETAALDNAEIQRLLRGGVLREWYLLLAARNTYLQVAQPPCPGLEVLVSASMRRLADSLSSRYTGSPTRADLLSELLEAREAALALVERIEMSGDAIIRERARLAGRAILARVDGVYQPRPSRSPCQLRLLTDQEVVRCGEGAQLQTRGGAVVGRVARLREAPGGGFVITLDLISGFRRGTCPQVGEILDWDDCVLFGGMYSRSRARAAGSVALAATRSTPPSWPRLLPGEDLLDEALRLRVRREEE